MTEDLRPGTADEVLEAVEWAVAETAPLEVVAAGSKRAFGRPSGAAARLELAALAGIDLYEPPELVLSAKAATPLVEIEAALAENRQRLEFEPPDLGPLLGGPSGRGTLAGAVACNLAGPRRIKAGAARDHVLGFHAVSGRGGAFKSGGRVVKNVTGFDLSKLMAGSFGTLAVMTAITVKVLPAAHETRTVLVLGADDGAAVGAMTAALHSPYDVSGAAHLPPAVAAASAVRRVAGAGRAVTAVRLEGPGPSVEVRSGALNGVLSGFGDLDALDAADSVAFWREIRDAAFLAADTEHQVWRLSLPPAQGAAAAAAILADVEGWVFYDWGGGLLWLAIAPRPDAAHEAVRRAAEAHGGHATLVRAADAVRGQVPVFHPQPAPLAALAARVKEAFDPRRVLNPGRMVEGV